MYDIDVNGTQNVLDAASGAGIEHLLVASSTTAYGAWPGQPGAAHRGASGPRHAQLRVRARQDRDRPHVPALGGTAPEARDDDRSALHRVRPERRQLHRPVLGQRALHPADRRSRHGASSTCTRRTSSRRVSRLLLERKAGIFNLTGDGTVKLSEGAAIAGSQDAQGAVQALQAARGGVLEAARAACGGAARAARLLALPVDGVEREDRRRSSAGSRGHSRETFEAAMRAKGKLASTSAGAPAPDLVTPVA